MKFISLFALLFALMPICALSQHGASVGLNYNWVRDNNILSNEKPIFGYQFGYSYKKDRKLAMQYELLVGLKGYKQVFEEKYDFSKIYLLAPVLVNFRIMPKFSVLAGAELGISDSDNDPNRSRFDAGLLFGFECFNVVGLKLFSRYSHGLFPLINYYKFDKLGNILSELHDVKNSTITFGIKYEIPQYKK
ncbi:MAG: outer membrane beta-barrel protein [Prolixibacteraceae bacterium]|nr:outer membrane beta-barrel protein [Prolixibacteraceae bacterium]